MSSLTGDGTRMSRRISALFGESPRGHRISTSLTSVRGEVCAAAIDGRGRREDVVGPREWIVDVLGDVVDVIVRGAWLYSWGWHAAVAHDSHDRGV